MKLRKLGWNLLGIAGVGLGALGAVLPVLPTFPFLLLAAFSFAKGSDRLYQWFVGTDLYKKNLESYVKGQGMTKKTKVRIMATVTILMSFGFIMMFRKAVYVPCVILGAVWLFHVLYFTYGVKTYRIEK